MEDLTRRFLDYSLHWRRPIRLVWMAGEEIQTGNVTVIRLGESSFDYTSARSRTRPLTLPLDDVLSAAYARGDDGDTMKNLRRLEGETR